MVENVGVAVEIASPPVCVRKLFQLPVSTSGFVADICGSGVGRCRAVLAVSYLSRVWSIMWGRRLNRFAICFRSKGISTSGSVADIVPSRCRSISDNVGGFIFRSGVVENMASVYRIPSLCLSIQKLCVHACVASAILKFACRSTCHVTSFTHLWVFSSPVLSGQLF